MDDFVMDEYWFFIPDRKAWKYWQAESDLQKDIDFELLLDEIQLFEVGEDYEKNET